MPEKNTPVVEITTSRTFNDWLATAGGAIAMTTYQAGKVLLLGLNEDGSLSLFERSFPRVMGLAVSDDGRTLMLASKVQMFRFDNVVVDGEQRGKYDAIFVPHATWMTGDLDIHDVGIGSDDRPIFVNTLFNCIATVSDGHSFRALWRPPFITRLVPEDRCHINGLALKDGLPRYVTCVSQSDVADGWRDRRVSGGLVIDVQSGDVVVEGLSMPHSPRLFGDRLWLLNSGTGEFGWVDLKSGQFSPVAFCPGYARGLAFVGNHAIVGLSRAREDKTFGGLELDAALIRHDADARCGLAVVNLESGAVVDWVRIEGEINELFDVTFISGVRCPVLLGVSSNEANRIISFERARDQ